MEDSGIIITPFRYRHIDRVLEIESICFSDPWSRNLFSFALRDGQSHFMVAYLDNEVVGYAGIYVIFEEVNLDTIAVHPDYTGRGIAKALILKFIDFSKELGLNTLTLEVRQSNKRARALYEYLGFYEIGKRIGYYRNPSEDAILMDLKLEN